MTPADFTNMPINSILQNYKAEEVARKIMFILKRTGNTWRPLPWFEYLSAREQAGKTLSALEEIAERKLFDSVIDYCTSPQKARLFSHAWEGKIS